MTTYFIIYYHLTSMIFSRSGIVRVHNTVYTLKHRPNAHHVTPHHHAFPRWDVCFDLETAFILHTNSNTNNQHHHHHHHHLRRPTNDPNGLSLPLNPVSTRTSLFYCIAPSNLFDPAARSALFTSWPPLAQGLRGPSARPHGSPQRKKTWQS